MTLTEAVEAARTRLGLPADEALWSPGARQAVGREVVLRLALADALLDEPAGAS